MLDSIYSGMDRDRDRATDRFEMVWRFVLRIVASFELWVLLNLSSDVLSRSMDVILEGHDVRAISGLMWPSRSFTFS